VIVEQRTYTYQPGKAADFLRLYEAEGMQVQLRCLGNLTGYYVTEIGTLNQTVTMWAYEDLAERERLRGALAEEPQWRAFLAKARPLTIRQETAILSPAPFFRELLRRMLQEAGKSQ